MQLDLVYKYVYFTVMNLINVFNFFLLAKPAHIFRAILSHTDYNACRMFLFWGESTFFEGWIHLWDSKCSFMTILEAISSYNFSICDFSVEQKAFDLDEYLRKNTFQGAPVSCFKHVSYTWSYVI